MQNLDPQLSQQYPGAKIAKGAIVPTDSQIAPGCQLGSQVSLAKSVVLEPNVSIQGAVTLKKGCDRAPEFPPGRAPRNWSGSHPGCRGQGRA